MKTICPHCNYKATAHSTLDDQTNPKDGDIGMCIKCGEFNQFKGKKLIKVDIQSLDEGTRRQASRLNVAWLRMRAGESVKGDNGKIKKNK